MQKISNKLLNWASIIEDNTLEQAKLTASMPFIHPHLALMPDAHLGKGATVGSVIPTKGAIMPAAVGVDIGCGMIAVQTQWSKKDLEGKDLSVLRHAIERSVPLSAGSYKKEITNSAKPRIEELERLAGSALDWYDKVTRTNWRYQLGTLGSGNHFIEITLDEEDNVWLFLHSGSRGIGNALAMHHIKIAQEQMKKWYIKLPDPDLSYLVEGTKEFENYIIDLNWAQHFALLNREEMMDRVMWDMAHFMRADKFSPPNAVVERARINCHHNFTQKEHHMGQDVWLSRKGAISAAEGTPGLIPGSMGTASYVVIGKGNVQSFRSSPHGAGRVFGRNAAKQRFTLKDMDEQMVGVEYNRSAAFLDEIPSAYKDIDVVMDDAQDLVEIQHTLRQIVNVKGD